MKRFALVGVPIASLQTEPKVECELADEALHGMTVEVLGESPDGWVRIRTHYNYEGFAAAGQLLADSALLTRWERLDKRVVTKAQADILSAPEVRGWRLISLPRGALVGLDGEPDENGWQRVWLADGRSGYTKAGFLGTYHTAPGVSGTALRRGLTEAALSYLGVQYRWGGKTPQGIDCSGLCSMAYMLNGILIYRDADIVEGFPMRAIPVEHTREGDLIFFKGHVAMCLGGGRFVHSTARNSDDGVVLGSLNPADAGYRPDLIPLIRFGGTVFGD